MSAEYRMSIAVDASGASSGVDNVAKAFANLEKYLSSMDRTLTGIEQGLNKTGTVASKASQNLDKSSKSFDKVEKEAKQAGDSIKDAGKDMDGMNGAVTKLNSTLGMLKGAFVGAMAFAGLGSVVQTADAMKTLDSQIKIATGSAEKHAIAMSEIERIAMANNVSLSSVGEMYVSNERALKQLGKSQQEVVKFTEQVTTAMRLGGGSAEAQSAALTQLGQALASGVLRGDEFNSIAEQAPMIMELMADSLNVTTGELRKMAGEGKLTADVVYDAMTSAGATEKLASMASQTSTTISGALENVRTQWDLAVHGLMNSEGGISSIIAGGIGLIADGLAKFGDYIPQINESISSVTSFISENSDVFIALASGIGAAAAAFGIFTFVTAGIPAIMTGITTAVAGASSVFAILTSPITLTVLAIGALVAAGVLLYQNWDTVKAKAIEVWNAIPQYASQAWQWIQGVWSGVGAWFGGIWDSVVSSVHVAWVAIKQAFANWLAGMPAPVQEMVANIGSIFSGIATIARAAWAGITAVAKTVFSAVVAVWKGLSSAVSSAWQGIVGVASSVWDSVKSTVTSAINAIKPIITSVASVFSAAWQGLVAVASSVWSAIKAAAMLGIAAIKASLTAGVTGFAVIFNAGFNAVKVVVSTVFNAIKALVRGDINAVKSVIQSGLSQLAGIARNAITQMIAAFRSAGAQMRSVGGDIIQGLINGVKAKIGEFLSTIRSMASQGLATLRGVMRTASPSKATREIGEWVSEGLAIGIDDKAVMPIKSAKDTGQKVLEAYKNELEGLERDIYLNHLKAQGNPFAEFTADLKFGKKYQGLSKEELAVLEHKIKHKETSANIASYAEEIRNIDAETVKIGKGKLELMELEYETTRKYIGLSREDFELLKRKTIVLETRKFVEESTAKIKDQIATLGMNEFELLKHQLSTAKEYQAVTEETKNHHVETVKALKQQEALLKSQKDLERATTIAKNVGDKYAGMRYDLQQQGFDQSTIDGIVGNQEKTDVATAFNDLRNQMGQTDDPFAKLEAENQRKLDIIQKARGLELAKHAEFDEMEKQQHAEFLRAKNELALTQGEQMLGSLTSIAKDAFGEQSKAYKVMFAMEKGMAIARSIMAIQTALASASASAPFPANLGVMATVAAQTASIIGNIKAVAMPVGQAHDGIMSVPKSGTWNLEKGERVLPKHTAKAMDDKLDSMGSGRVNVTVHNYSGQPTKVETDANGDIRLIVGQELNKQLPQHVNNPNSEFNKSLKNNYQLQRRL